MEVRLLSLLVWLPLIADSENYGVSPLQAQLPTCATLDTTGKIGKCYTSDGSAVGTISTFNYTFSQFTIAAWVRINTRVNSWRCTVKIANSGGDKDYIGFGCQNTNGTTLGFHFYKTISGTNTKIFDKYALTPTNGEWMHLAVTYDGQTATYYKNGVELSHDAIAAAVQNTNAVINQLILLGSDGSRSAAAVKDSLNDLRIYSHCLSAAEVHEISQGLVLHYKLDDLTDGSQDSSGYNHRGIHAGNGTLVTNTPRYTKAFSFNGNINNRIYCNSTDMNFTNDFSYSLWLRANYTGTTGQYIFTVGRADAGGYGYGIQNNSDTNIVCRYGTSYWNIAVIKNEWTHIVFTKNGNAIKIYKNGNLITNTTFSGTAPTYSDGNGLGIGCFHYTSDIYPAYGAVSDFRIYCTALSAEDVKQLYEVGAKVDNKGNLHTYEFNENSSNKLKKTGVFYNYATEPYIQLADGSCWKLLLFHYIDNGTNLFTSSNATYNDGFGLYSRLRDIDKFIYNNKYEFYVIQDDISYRWTQTNAPLTTTAVAGYTAISGSPGGICKCSGNTLLAASNTTSNWWQACGCWTIFNGGIPGFGGVVCKQYLALYARIDKITYHNASNAHYANNLIEL